MTKAPIVAVTTSLEHGNDTKLFSKRAGGIVRRRRHRRILRLALRFLSVSQFKFPYGSSCDQLLISLRAFDYKTFHALLQNLL